LKPIPCWLDGTKYLEAKEPPCRALIALAVLAVLMRTKKVPEPLLILAAGMVGILLKQYGS
jgi:chromate transport protein ChrA